MYRSERWACHAADRPLLCCVMAVAAAPAVPSRSPTASLQVHWLPIDLRITPPTLAKVIQECRPLAFLCTKDVAACMPKVCRECPFGCRGCGGNAGPSGLQKRIGGSAVVRSR